MTDEDDFEDRNAGGGLPWPDPPVTTGQMIWLERSGWSRRSCPACESSCVTRCIENTDTYGFCCPTCQMFTCDRYALEEIAQWRLRNQFDRLIRLSRACASAELPLELTTTNVRHYAGLGDAGAG